MTDILITGGVGVLSSILTGLVTFFTTKKKYTAEVEQNVIENMQKSLDFYAKLSDDTQKRLDEMSERYNKSEERNFELEKEVRELRKQVTLLMSNICIDATCKGRKVGNELFGNKKVESHDTKTSKKGEEPK